MKKIIILNLVSFLILIFTACSTGTTNQEVKGKSMMMTSSTDSMSMKTNMHEYYTCTMHPQIIKDKPGKCPICGMDLIKKQGEPSHSMNKMGMDSIIK
jgi:Cu(I)/Ag(I) efflux system membrane fusion protein